MFKRALLTLLFFSIPGGAVFGASDVPVAEDWVWPLLMWDTVSVKHGDPFGDQYHMGIDAGSLVGAGGEVIASADGIVRESEERTQFGLVILIEHELPNGKRIVSLYGHLRPGSSRVKVGETVKAGQIIGVLGNSKENGGWSPHIHFGIHKEPYTGEWKYYGHVNNPETAKEWYDPLKFIPKRMPQDTWKPYVKLRGIQNTQVIQGKMQLRLRVGDVGQGVDSVTVTMKHHGKVETLYSTSSVTTYPIRVNKSLKNYSDGRFIVRARVVDKAGNERTQKFRFSKMAGAKTNPHIAFFATTKKRHKAQTVYQAGSVSEPFTAYGKNGWIGEEDIAIGDVTGNGEKNVVTVKTNQLGKAIVRVFNAKGKQLDQFVAFKANQQSGARIATGDMNGDGADEIIVASAPGKKSRVKVFDSSGKFLWKKTVYKKEHTYGVDVAAGDVDRDGKAEIIAGSRSGNKATIAIIDGNKKRLNTFRAYEKKYMEGVNVSSGDINGDGVDEIVVVPEGKRAAEIRFFQKNGKHKRESLFPYGEESQSAMDVSVGDWDNDARDDISVSRYKKGSVRVSTFNLDYVKPRVFKAKTTARGLRIATW